MSKKMFFPVLAILVLAILTLACGASTPAPINANCQPTATEVLSTPVDENLDWQYLGPTGTDYSACGLYMRSSLMGGLEYRFQEHTSGTVNGMAKVTFSDGTIKYFKSVAGVFYSATE